MTQVIKIAIVGAECTGKSTLAAELATHFQSTYPSKWVPEYLREFSEKAERTPFEEEQAFIAQTQKNLEAEIAKSLIKEANGHAYALLFCDTTPLLTNIYNEIVFSRPHPELEALCHHDDYDLTLLTAIDFPWQADPMRDGPDAQKATHQLLSQKLLDLKIKHEVISGSIKERVAQAQNLIQELVL